ncbi:MAG: hypothetical protein KDA45_05945 [Planctomycetales bacterium]|nr:hypothetical protein [Planctomycetales bacterium]
MRPAIRRWLPVFCLCGPALLCGPLASCLAQGQAKRNDSANKLILGFRMQNWNAQHMHDPTKAQEHVDLLRKLGCEVKTSQHNGHIDVESRTVFWKSMALESPAQLEQWRSWLQQSGFETLYGHSATEQASPPAAGAVLEVVKYRLPEWRAQHIHQPQEVGQLTTLYRALGCELENRQHDGHTDLRIRCPQWMQIELPTHEAAHLWQAFLQQAGFETSHTH